MRKSSSPGTASVKYDKNDLQAILKVLQPDFKRIIKEGVLEYGQMGARLLYELLMAAEVTTLCGEPYERNSGRQGSRWGSEPGKARAGGGKTTVERPRVRTSNGESEIPLESYEALNKTELLTEALLARLLAGVSTRRYSSTIDKSLRKGGVSRSSISRAAISATKPMVDEFFKRKLNQLHLVVLLLDGVNIGGKQMIVCIGIDSNGRKHLVGVRLGATENYVVCRDLIQDMKERGLSEDSPYLFVIDGSKSLASAIKTAFGDHTAIQRCQEHKIRNVQGYLPHKEREAMRSKLQAAYSQKTERGASKRLEKIRLELSVSSQQAEKALVEGLHETLTVHRLEIKGMLRTALRTTNIIESAFSSARRYMGRVTHFTSEAQRERCAIRSLIETERHFRTVKGHRQLSQLQEKLKQLIVPVQAAKATVRADGGTWPC